MNAEMAAGFEIEEGLVGGSAYDAHGQSMFRRRHGKGYGRGRDAVWRRRWAEMGRW